MANKKKQFDVQFKKDAVKYLGEHPDLTIGECVKNLGIGKSTLARWKGQLKKNDGHMPYEKN